MGSRITQEGTVEVTWKSGKTGKHHKQESSLSLADKTGTIAEEMLMNTYYQVELSSLFSTFR